MTAAGDLLDEWARAGRSVIHESDTKAMLASANVSVPNRDPGEGACVVKLASDRFPHKTEHGLVKLNVAPADAAAVGEAMREKDPAGVVIVEEMVQDGIAEWIVGCRHDATFGPVVVIGAGGVFVELFDEAKVRLAPVDRETALRAITTQKAAKLLNGARGKPAGDIEALTDLVVNLSRFFHENASRIEEIEINPVIVRRMGAGAVAADALMKLRSTTQ